MHRFFIRIHITEYARCIFYFFEVAYARSIALSFSQVVTTFFIAVYAADAVLGLRIHASIMLVLMFSVFLRSMLDASPTFLPFCTEEYARRISSS